MKTLQKPVRYLGHGKAYFRDCNVDAPGSAFFFQWHAEAVDKIYDEIAPTGGRDVAMIRRSLGVMGLVRGTPIRYGTWKLAPALV